MGKREELALFVQYFYSGSVKERCYNLKVLTKLYAESIKTEMQKMIQQLVQLSGRSTICSIEADKALVMSGQFHGVAQKLRGVLSVVGLYSLYCSPS